MITWIQGDDFGRKFKALVSHDGPFIGDGWVETDELWFVEHEVNPLLFFSFYTHTYKYT